MLTGHGVTLFRLFGIPVRLDASWIIIAVLVTWSLAAGFFPAYFAGLADGTYLAMAVVGAIGLFASILFHEFSHSLVGRRHGIHVRSITLFVFGGVADMHDEPPRARAEFWMAIAGPIASVVLAVAFTGLLFLGDELGWPMAVGGIFFWLAWMNTLLAAFNVLPAFPLDGGRVLRSLLWHYKRDLAAATRITARIGGGAGIVMIGLGILAFLGGAIIAGIWWFLLGLFLRRAAGMSYQQVLMRRFLEDETVRDLMKKDVTTVPPSLTIGELVHKIVYEHHYKLYPVVEDGALLGCVTLESLKRVDRDRWPEARVRELLEPCTDENTIGPDVNAYEALRKLQRVGRSRLLVVEDGRLAGILAVRDVFEHFTLRAELEGERGPGTRVPPVAAPRERREPVGSGRT